MEPVVMVILLAAVEVIVFGARAGLARGRNGVKAPAVVGDEEFERYFRVHYNTIEQMILFLPGIWFFAQYVNIAIAVILGILFVFGRLVYAVNYVKDPPSRTLGMLFSIVPCWILVLGALVGVVWSLLGEF